MAQFLVPVANDGNGYIRLAGVGQCEARQAAEPVWELQDRDVGTLTSQIMEGTGRLESVDTGYWGPVTLDRTFLADEE